MTPLIMLMLLEGNRVQILINMDKDNKIIIQEDTKHKELEDQIGGDE